MFSFLQKDVSDVIASLENAYYIVRKAEIEKELQSVESTLQSVDIKENLRLLRAYSLQILKNEIAEHYRADTRTAFTIKNIKSQNGGSPTGISCCFEYYLFCKKFVLVRI